MLWRKIKARHFFTSREKEKIVLAIHQAEQLTSGEIRVHVEHGTGGDPMARAVEVFAELGMDRTREHNGVLIYLAVGDRKFAIIGDREIDKVVPDDFWQTTQALMSRKFQSGNFVDGVCLGIGEAGRRLAEHFPYRWDDQNELTDEISEGE